MTVTWQAEMEEAARRIIKFYRVCTLVKRLHLIFDRKRMLKQLILRWCAVGARRRQAWAKGPTLGEWIRVLLCRVWAYVWVCVGLRRSGGCP